MKSKIFTLLLLAVLILLTEAGLSTFLLYRYRLNETVRDGRGLFSIPVAAEKIFTRLGLRPYEKDSAYEFKKEGHPNPFLKNDSLFGYVAIPGTYSHIYQRRPKFKKDAPWEQLKIKVTVNRDGSRWTGQEVKSGQPGLYIFGDSYVFGSGVNDEQTFSYRLQSERPGTNVRLFALAGYGLPQAYRRFELLKDEIKETDTVVIGYGDFYDERGVLPPSRFRGWNARHEVLDFHCLMQKDVLKVDLDEKGNFLFSLVNEDCAFNGDYCQKPDPSQEEMTRMSAALINAIAEKTSAKVYLLHIDGRKDNPIFKLLNPKIQVISVLPEDFDSFMRDDIAGFDPHPGPYWHDAVSRRLNDALQK